MKSEAVYLRITPELKQALKELAQNDERPLSQYIRVVLQDHVEKMQQKKD